MIQAKKQKYWDDFFVKKSDNDNLTRNFILLSILSDDIDELLMKSEKTEKIEKKILEVGCGQAFFSQLMSMKGYDTYSLDFCFNALLMAKESFKQKKLKNNIIVGDATKLPLESDKLDLIYSAGLLDIFEIENLPLREMYRVLKDNGIVVSVIPNRKFSIQTVADIYNSFIHLIKLLLGKKNLMWNEYKLNLNHAKNYSLRQYVNSFEAAGFEVFHAGRGYPVPEISLPSSLKTRYVHLIDMHRGFFKNKIMSKNWLYHSLGIYYYVFARKNSK